MINDSSKAITAEDVIRRYNLEGLKTDRKVIKQVTTTIENQYTIIKNFVINLAPYTNQTDTTVWFSNGVPNLSDPLFDNIDTNKVNICYDRDNGVAYKLENNSWVVINDNTLLQSLAIASSEPDAEDKKRNVFYNQPTPPYAVGDLWLDGDTIMRCRCSRDGDSFNNAEWVEQNNYSSVNVLLDVRAVLDSFIEEVYDDFATKVLLETTKDGINAEVSKKVGDDEIISKINQTAEQIKINANKVSLEITCDYTYTQQDVQRIQDIYLGTITPTQQDYQKYDLDRNGTITPFDAVRVNNIIRAGITPSTPGQITFISDKTLSAIKILGGNGKEYCSIGFHSSKFSNPNGSSIELSGGMITLTDSNGNTKQITATN